MRVSIGIDVHQASLQIAIADGKTWRVNTTPAALRGLGTRLATLHPDVVVLEPSGGYERPVLELLWARAIPVALVHPGQVRAFIRGQGIRAKSDPLDARMLAWFGHSMIPRLITAPTPTQRQVQDLVRHRRTLVTDVTRWTHRQHQVREANAQLSVTRILTALKAEIATVTTTIRTLVTTAPEWTRPREILHSTPGIADTTVALLLAELPELGHIADKALAALVGVAPMTHQSGTGPETAHIAGGRRGVREGMWMPTLSAMRWNPAIKRLADRLQANPRPHKVIVIACMRKLLCLLNAMLAHDTRWDPTLVPQA